MFFSVFDLYTALKTISNHLQNALTYTIYKWFRDQPQIQIGRRRADCVVFASIIYHEKDVLFV